jgi:dihydropteroate synthase
MGVVNVTPDSFSDGGRFVDPDRAIDHARRLVAEGAAVIDVGGESSRPGAEPVDAATEVARVLPVVEALAGEVRVSIDTAKAEVARRAIDAGATLVNDITASLHPVAAEAGVGWVAMHMQGEPRTMQRSPHYRDVASEVLAHLVERASQARRAGVEEVWIDPGIGFGKTADHNWALLAAMPRFAASGFPVVVGTSRKAFLGALFGDPDPVPVHDRLEGSVVTALRAVADGATMVRVHDVAATVAALEAVAA